MKNLKVLMIIAALFVNAGIVSSVYAEEAKTAADQKEIVELQPKDFKPAFTRDTVIKLNKIVRRSHALISRYDAIIRDARTAVESNDKPAAQKQVAGIKELAQKSTLVLDDMMEAVKELKASGEEYNAAILAGMLDFVEDVEREMNAEQTKLEKVLGAA